MSQLVSYYCTSSLLNKEWNGSLFIKYYLGLYLIRNTFLVLDIGTLFRVNSPPIP